MKPHRLDIEDKVIVFTFVVADNHISLVEVNGIVTGVDDEGVVVDCVDTTVHGKRVSGAHESAVSRYLKVAAGAKYERNTLHGFRDDQMWGNGIVTTYTAVATPEDKHEDFNFFFSVTYEHLESGIQALMLENFSHFVEHGFQSCAQEAMDVHQKEVALTSAQLTVPADMPNGIIAGKVLKINVINCLNEGGYHMIADRFRDESDGVTQGLDVLKIATKYVMVSLGEDFSHRDVA